VVFNNIVEKNRSVVDLTSSKSMFEQFSMNAIIVHNLLQCTV
jgi:hypothetical protein